MKSRFFAVLSRMKYINRWGLMRNTRSENLSEHCMETALFAHALVCLDRREFGGTLNPEHAAMLALYHDASEIFTGDMPTPVKYYNPAIREAYAVAENAAKEKLVGLLPPPLTDDVAPLIDVPESDSAYLPFLKAADKLSALVKCIEERKLGNSEFADAEQSISAAIRALHLPAADRFVALFMDSFHDTLDQQGKD